LFILVGNLHAQWITTPDPKKADSLAQLLPRLKGIDKAMTMTELSKQVIRSNFDSAKLLIEKALAIAREEENDSTVVKILTIAGDRISDHGDHDLARKYLYTARAMEPDAELSPNVRGEIYFKLYNVHYWHLTNYDSCRFYMGKYISIVKDSVSLGTGYIELGMTYHEQGNNAMALEYYIIADTYLQTPRTDPWTLSHLNNCLGMLYYDEQELKQTEKFLLKAYELTVQSNIRGADVPELNNLGVLYNRMGEHDKALKYLTMAKEKLPLIDDPFSVANNFLNTGDALTFLGRHNEGVASYKESIMRFDKLKDEYKIAAARVQLAGAYRRMKRYREAEQEAMLALAWDQNKGEGDLVKESYKELHNIFNETRQYDKAYDYQSRYLKIVDSLNSADRKKKIGVMEKNFEIAKQERVRERLERENELHLAQAEADRITRIGLIAGTIALAIGVVIATGSYRRIRSQKQKIEEQAQQLQEAATAKSRFFANVSHELRTPLTLLNGMLELMQESPTRQGTEQQMEIALGNSRRLQGMINEVLDLSRLEGGKWEISRKPKEMLPLLTRIVMAFESLFVKKNIRLEYEASSLMGLVMDIDEDKFEKVINNLVYNAIKFNHEGGWIRVTATRTDKNVLIQVVDSGIGIPEKELPYIFDRFYQSSSSEKINCQGIGIGLALVREFTALHGGDVNVTSRVGDGSCFTVQFPIDEVTSGQGDVVKEDSGELPDVSFENLTKKPVILVVEDNEEMRFYLKEILGEYAGIAETRHGREGLKWLKTHTPDLIISDIMMPEMDGYEFLQQLKASPIWRGIPVVMLTARASEEDLLHGLSLGVDDYIIKPFNAKELKIRVHNLLTNQEIRKDWIQKPLEPGESAPEAVTSENQVFLEKVRAFVEQNAELSSLGIGDLADHMAMSERQVYRHAATLTGMTPGQLVKEIKLKIAYKLLLERKVSKVAELARRVGFENSSYFSKQFLERYGKRPGDFL
jgi:signal transduction histidine kinase/DNA-binding response OmpR family regulator